MVGLPSFHTLPLSVWAHSEMEVQLSQAYFYFKLSLFRKILSAFIAIQLVCPETFLSAVLCDPGRCILIKKTLPEGCSVAQELPTFVSTGLKER